jgi:hypothetical protein
MKNTKIALFTLAAALVVSPMAFGGTINLTGLDGTLAKFDLTGTYTAGGLVVTSAGTFDQTGAGAGDTTPASYSVVSPIHESYMGAGVMNDNLFTNSNNPFTANGLLIKITGGVLTGDYVYINGINGLDTDQVAVTVFTKLTGGEVESINYTVKNNDIVTPEPSSLFLLGTGILSLAGLLFWKSKSSASSLPSLSL